MRAPETVRTFLSALVEVDGRRRMELLEASTSESVQLEIEGAGPVDGRPAVSAWVAEQVQDPLFWLYTRHRPLAVGEDWTLSLRIRRTGEQPTDHRALARMEGGKVAALMVQPGVAVPPSRFRRSLDWAMANPAPVAALAGGAAYALVRFPVALFYNELGVTPEEAGFDVQDLLRQSLILLILIGLASLAIAVLFVVILVPAINLVLIVHRLWTTDHQKLARRVVGIGYLPFALLFVLFALAVAGFDPEWLNAAVLLLLVLVALMPQVTRLLPGTSVARDAVDDARRRRRASLVSVLPVGVAYFLTVALAIVLPTIAVSDAQEVRRGGTVSSVLLVWRARPAELTWAKDASVLPLANDCRRLRYLGGTKERQAVFDSEANRAFIIPSGQVTVAVARTCPG